MSKNKKEKQPAVETAEAVEAGMAAEEAAAADTQAEAASDGQAEAASQPEPESYTLTAEEFWELYDTCIVPDLRDGNIGGTKIIQDEDFYQALEPIYITATGVHTNSNGEYVYNYYTVRPLTTSARTNAWLRSHGVTVQTLGELNNVEGNGFAG